MSLTVEEPCFVCNLSERNDLRYGEWITKGQLSVHLFCLYFSRDLPQNGEVEASGICRFLIKDIKKLRSNSTSSKCSICHKPFATLYCNGAFCALRFHVICAVRQEVLFQFCDNFFIFCPTHYPESYDAYGPRHPLEPDCRICLDPLPTVYSPVNLLKACCCSVWFHTDCVRRFALSAGYYFGCMCCRENKPYVRHCQEWGVYVPQREANWENAQNFGGLVRKKQTCDAEPCHVSARNRSTAKNPFLVCNLCGSYTTHLNCINGRSRADITAETYACDVCAQMKLETTLASSQQKGSLSTMLKTTMENHPQDDALVASTSGIASAEDEDEHGAKSCSDDDDDKDLMNTGFYIDSDYEDLESLEVISVSSSSD